VPRLWMSFQGEWGETSLALPEGNWKNLLSRKDVQGGTRRLADLFGVFPIALLIRVDDK